MLQNHCKTLGFMKNMTYKISPVGGGKPYPASGLNVLIEKLINSCLGSRKCVFCWRIFISVSLTSRSYLPFSVYLFV